MRVAKNHHLIRFLTVGLWCSQYLGGCALPRPVAVERQDFVSKKDVLVASLVRQAQSDYLRGRYQDTEGGLRKALHLAPDTTQVSLNLARVLSKNGQLPEAMKIFERILLRKPKDFVLTTFVGESLYEAGEYEKAEQFFDRSLELIALAQKEMRPVETKDIEAAERSKVVTAFRRSDIEGAICLAHETFVRGPNPENVIKLARLELAFGRYSQAEQRITSFLLSNPGTNDARIYLIRALAHLGQGLEDKGKEDLRAAQNREESIGDYSFELLVLSEAFLPPPPLEEGEEHTVEEEDTLSLQELSAAQRLFFPLAVLKVLDENLLKKKLRYDELGLGE